MNQPSNGPGIASAPQPSPSVLPHVNVEYVGSKPRKSDTTFGTGIVWEGQGEVRPVPQHIAIKMATLHPDIWAIVGPDAKSRPRPEPEAPAAKTKAPRTPPAAPPAPPKRPPAPPTITVQKRPVASLEEVVNATARILEREDLTNHVDTEGAVKIESLEKETGKLVTGELRDQAMAEIADAADTEGPQAE